MKISIIVPIYKVERYLIQCIESIVNQTYRNLEIILVDDGSPDRCPQICDDYANRDDRIIVIHKENGGLVSARQAGLKASTGEYIGFVDGDDRIDEQMYEEVAKTIETYSPDMVSTEFWFSFPDKDVPSQTILTKAIYRRSEIQQKILPKMLYNGTYYQFGIYPNCWTKIVKKSILAENLYSVNQQTRMGEDASFTYGCIMDSDSIAYIDKPLYYYRNTQESMSNAYDQTLSRTYMNAYYAVKEKAETLGIDLTMQLSNYLIYMVNFVLRNEASKSNQSSRKDKAAVLKQLVRNREIFSAAKQISYSAVPAHLKILLTALRMRSTVLLKAYMMLYKILKKV